jgi:hypothetical protein
MMGLNRNSGATGDKLDGKLCFELWAKCGSVYKARFILANEHHIINQKLNKPYSHQAVWLAANTYILNHPDEARPLWNSILKANGVFPTDELWFTFVGSKAKRLPRKLKDEYLKVSPHLVEYA